MPVIAEIDHTHRIEGGKPKDSLSHVINTYYHRITTALNTLGYSYLPQAPDDHDLANTMGIIGQKPSIIDVGSKRIYLRPHYSDNERINMVIRWDEHTDGRYKQVSLTHSPDNGFSYYTGTFTTLANGAPKISLHQYMEGNFTDPFTNAPLPLQLWQRQDRPRLERLTRSLERKALAKAA